MGVRLKVGGDLSASDLRKLARKEGDGKVVGRLLAIASALDGLTRNQASKQAGMNRQILADWVHRYNEGGVEGLRDKPKGHPKRLLTAEQAVAIKARVLAAPDPEKDGLVRWRCVDIAAFIADTYKIDLHKRTVAKLLTRMGLSHISVRPKYPKSDSEAQDTFLKNFVATVADTIPEHASGKPLEIWFCLRRPAGQDEARVGQKGTLTYVWGVKGSRPRAVADQRYACAWTCNASVPV